MNIIIMYWLEHEEAELLKSVLFATYKSACVMLTVILILFSCHYD